MLQTPGQSFLRFGSKKPGSRSGGSGEDSGGNTIMIRENGVSLVSGDEVERSSLSNVPKLPNIDSKDEKSTARGLRRLQVQPRDREWSVPPVQHQHQLRQDQALLRV